MLPSSHHEASPQLRVALLHLLVAGGAGGGGAGRRRGTDGRQRYAVKVLSAAAQAQHLAVVCRLLLLQLLRLILWRGRRRQNPQPIVALHRRQLWDLTALALPVLLQHLRRPRHAVTHLRRLDRHQIDRVFQGRDGKGRRGRIRQLLGRVE